MMTKGLKIQNKDITVVKCYGYDNCFVGDKVQGLSGCNQTQRLRCV